MTISLLLTLIGEDRPGLVEALSDVLTQHGGNWEESRMATLGGKFAGILLVTVPASNSDALIHALDELKSQGLHVRASHSSGTDIPRARRTLNLTLVGQDHPGIIRDISHALADRHINIEELSSACSSASWSGETLFHATARLRIPANVPIDEIRETLEGLANELMVDIHLDEAAASASAS